jgi:protein-disulfide isomerase
LPPVPSGKKSKQARRQAASAPPPVVSKGGVRRRQANPRVLAVAGGIAVLAIVGIVLGVTLTGGGKKIPAGVPSVGSIQSGLPGSAEVEAMYKGIPQKGTFLGNPFAPVQMVIYIDLQCPICQNYETTAMPTLITKYVRPGKVRVELKPWAFIGPDSFRGQQATFAAAKQNKAFNFAQVLYDNQNTEHTNWMNDAKISQIAASVDGLKPYQLATDANNADTKSVIKTISDFAAAHPTEMTGTPTLYLGKGRETPKYFYTGDPGLGNIQAAIDALLNK